MSGQSTSSGLGFGGFLTLLFIGLKLTHYIDWSWWWVLSPIWIGLGSLLVGVLIFIIIVGIITVVNKKKAEASRKKSRSAFQKRLEELSKKKSYDSQCEEGA